MYVIFTIYVHSKSYGKSHLAMNVWACGYMFIQEQQCNDLQLGNQQVIVVVNSFISEKRIELFHKCSDDSLNKLALFIYSWINEDNKTCMLHVSYYNRCWFCSESNLFLNKRSFFTFNIQILNASVKFQTQSKLL